MVNINNFDNAGDYLIYPVGNELNSFTISNIEAANSQKAIKITVAENIPSEVIILGVRVTNASEDMQEFVGFIKQSAIHTYLKKTDANAYYLYRTSNPGLVPNLAAAQKVTKGIYSSSSS